MLSITSEYQDQVYAEPYKISISVVFIDVNLLGFFLVHWPHKQKWYQYQMFSSMWTCWVSFWCIDHTKWPGLLFLLHKFPSPSLFSNKHTGNSLNSHQVYYKENTFNYNLMARLSPCWWWTCQDWRNAGDRARGELRGAWGATGRSGA